MGGRTWRVGFNFRVVVTLARRALTQVSQYVICKQRCPLTNFFSTTQAPIGMNHRMMHVDKLPFNLQPPLVLSSSQHEILDPLEFEQVGHTPAPRTPAVHIGLTSALHGSNRLILSHLAMFGARPFLTKHHATRNAKKSGIVIMWSLEPIDTRMGRFATTSL